MSRMETKKRVRRVHTREFKTETVALVRTGGRNAGQVARDLGLADGLVRTWVHQADVDAGNGPVGALTTRREGGAVAASTGGESPPDGSGRFIKRAATFFAKENA